MCGRIAQSEPRRFAERLDALILPGEEWRPRWNIGPMARILGVAVSDGVRVLAPYRWGLVPGWAKDPKMGARAFNARSETVADKPMFRHAVRKRRLLVPVDGFYEWAPAASPAAKQPYFFSRADGAPLVLAGLWEHWEGPEGEVRRTASVVTTAAGPDMPVHDRQPVILEPEHWGRWLDPSLQDPAELAPLFSAAGGVLVRHPVSTEVGSIRNEGPHLIEAAPLVADAGALGVPRGTVEGGLRGH